jgi:hypothetical protein
MPFDTGEGPHQPVLLGVSYALFPQSYPPSDFSPLLLQFLRCGSVAPSTLFVAVLTKTAEGGLCPRDFIKYTPRAISGLYSALTTRRLSIGGLVSS